MTTASDDMRDRWLPLNETNGRTKLDKIVEEEYDREAFDTRWTRKQGLFDWAKRIAERAFRHGVERCTEFYNERQGSGYTGNLRPAPAEEKCGDCGSPHHNACGIFGPGARTTFWGGFTPDRRKGERRKGTEELGMVDYYTGIGQFDIWRVPQAPRWKQETRTGKERRKP